jgi:hypothetical protein
MHQGPYADLFPALYPDYWCWYGTDSRGKLGVFPQAFIDLNTFGQGITNASLSGKKSTRTRGLFSRRPVSSSAASSLSGGKSSIMS